MYTLHFVHEGTRRKRFAQLYGFLQSSLTYVRRCSQQVVYESYTLKSSQGLNWSGTPTSVLLLLMALKTMFFLKNTLKRSRLLVTSIIHLPVFKRNLTLMIKIFS